MSVPSVVNGHTKGLIERLEAAEVGSRELDAEVCVSLQYGGLNSEGAENVRVDMEWGDDDLLFEVGEEKCCNPVPPVTTSLDAALSLAERALNDPYLWVGRNRGMSQSSAWSCELVVDFGEPSTETDAATGPLAICAAIFRAKEQAS